MINDKGLNAVGYLDPDMIEEAEGYRVKRNRAWGRWGALAACVCLAAAGAIKLGRHDANTGSTAMTGDPIVAVEQPQPEAEIGLGAADTQNAEVSPGNFMAAPLEGPAPDNDEAEYLADVRFMIGHFDSSLNKGDIAVNAGHVEFSGSLLAAIDELGESVRYRVVVEVFKDGTVMHSGSAEVAAEEERLVKENYIVAHETFEDTTETSDYFTIHAEADQLANFPASESYGYYISLYDEYLGLDEPAEGSYNVFSGPAQFAGIPADGSCSDADVYPDEILEIRQHICDGMAAGVLPFVYDAAICEDPLRIEVSVDTADEKLTEEFMSEYDPTGQYIVIVR